MEFKEIEYKYWAMSLTKEELAARVEQVIVENSLKAPETIYVVSCDDYYIRDSDDETNFVRFRKGGGIYEHLTEGRKSTWKRLFRRLRRLSIST